MFYHWHCFAKASEILGHTEDQQRVGLAYLLPIDRLVTHLQSPFRSQVQAPQLPCAQRPALQCLFHNELLKTCLTQCGAPWKETTGLKGRKNLPLSRPDVPFIDQS